MSLENILTKNIDRREFLERTTKAIIGLAGLLSGCATTSFNETAPVIYPPLKGHKVQPPENGCLIGFGLQGSWSVYERATGKRPAIMPAWVSAGGFISGFPNRYTDHFAKASIIPFPIAGVQHMDLEEIANGQKDKYIEAFAEGSVKFGQQYGGFFYDPMWEFNIDKRYATWSWADQPKSFKRAWQHMWQIFEDKGANDYVTWVIEYHVDFPLEGYWPGDQCVDWIGLSAYNREALQQYYGYRTLRDLIVSPYSYFRKMYRDKPVMLAEFGSTIGSDQPRWISNAFKTIKSMPGIKAAIYFDNIFTYPGVSWSDNHELSEESLKTLREVFKDPYWIGVE
jgi:hypothetical protein